jgi:3-hydroxybutyryl-CoA dehydrogenase
MKISEIQSITIIGTGTIGQQIALQCALYHYEVVLYDLSEAILVQSLVQIKNYLQKINHFQMNDPYEILNKIKWTTDINKAAQANLLIKSVFENKQLKKDIFEQFDQLCNQDTIFTTNSSTLLPSVIAPPARAHTFAALHFHTLVWESPVVDIMPLESTTQGTIIKLIKHLSVL